MIKITKTELISVVRLFVLANTPYSLFNELNNNLTIKKIQNQCTIKELTVYYDDITARTKRSEITMGLAYAVFVALMNKHRDEGIIEFRFDSERLDWGRTMLDYFQSSGKNTQTISVNFEQSPLIQLIKS